MGMGIYTSSERAALVQSVAENEIAAVRAAASALREAEHQLGKHERKTEDARKLRDKRRLELGRALCEARKKWPARGPRAKGWGEFLEREGIAQQTAWDLMQLAGYVEEISPQNENGGETSDEPAVPTRAEVSAARRAKNDEQEESVDVDVDVEDLEGGQVDVISTGVTLDIRLGDWHQVLSDVGVVDAVITDPPYSTRTHEAVIDRRADGIDADGLAPTYAAWTDADVFAFVDAWAPRCRGWIVALTDSELIPVWKEAYRKHNRYAFAPVPCVITGMSVRIQGDGPSSWAVYAMVSRPRDLAKWGTLPGAYVGVSEHGAKSGRGKPRWLMDGLIRDYTRGGDLVCDPMAGYGVTLAAAMAGGRRAVGAEIDSTARDEAIRRWRSSNGE